MNITLELETTAYNIGQLPELGLPQVAMAGRSNVGKSSLINALGGRKKLAKVSASPGKTRSINFYLVKPCAFYLVDLPGYGYARASHAERQAWAKILERYLAGSALKGLILLLDCRLVPQRLDLELAEYAGRISLPLLPVLTKIDKCSQKERQQRQEQWREITGMKPLLVSSSKRSGLDKLWKAIITFALGSETDICAAGEDKPEMTDAGKE